MLRRRSARAAQAEGRSAGLARNEDGYTAVEFALVATPFLMLVFGIIGAGLYFFTAFSMEHAIEQASRAIRVGSFKTANSGAGMSTLDFKNSVCSFAPPFVDCQNKVRVQLVTVGASGFSSATPPSCTKSGGDLADETASAGTLVNVGQSMIVLALVCYQFDLAANIPFLKLGGMSGANSNNAALIQAAVTFRTEPYGD
jgi:Flp pilus assembly protein TadG